MTQEIKVPDFNFMARLYPEVRQALRQRGRVNVPELTVESDRDPFMQLEQDMALIAHHCSCLGDWVARHFMLPTSTYRPGVAALLRVVDEHLAGPTPATVDLVGKLTRAFSVDQAVLVPARSRFSTLPGVDRPAIYFESGASPQGCSRTDQVLVKTCDASAPAPWGAWTVGAAPWAAPAAGDAVYVGHADLLFDALAIALGTAAAGLTAVWEYYGRTETRPDAATWDGTTLTLTIDGLFGSSASMAGAAVMVYCVSTGRRVVVSSSYVGGVNLASTTDTLGQAAPSTAAAGYIVSIEWSPLPGISGAQASLGSISATAVGWDLPQDAARSWTTTTVDGVVGYWVRWRLAAVAGGCVAPVLAAGAVAPGAADFYALVPVTQGYTVDDTLGTSDGSASQAFPLNRTTLVEGTLRALLVGTDDGWIVTEEATDLYAADPSDRLALLEMLPDGSYQVLCGDGTTGAIPPSGDAIVCSYRIGADDDGNVGAGAISRNVSGVAYLTSTANPRPASGWAAAEGSSASGLARVKRVKPAAYRSQGKAINADDCEALVINDFATSDGAKPVARAWGVEEAFGLKTIGLVVVGKGGGVVSSEIPGEIETWFNGADPNDPVRRLLANTEVTCLAFTPVAVSGAVTVTVRRSGAGVEAEVQAILAVELQPLATFEEDGTYRWQPGRYGGKVKVNQVEAIIYEQLSVRRPTEVQVTDLGGGGAVDLSLGLDELPACGVWAVSVVVI